MHPWTSAGPTVAAMVGIFLIFAAVLMLGALASRVGSSGWGFTFIGSRRRRECGGLLVGDAAKAKAAAHTKPSSAVVRGVLLDDSVRTGVRPDSVQAFGGMLSLRLPTA